MMFNEKELLNQVDHYKNRFENKEKESLTQIENYKSELESFK